VQILDFPSVNDNMRILFYLCAYYMPATTDIREQRQQAILDIISAEPVGRQSVLVERLNALGFNATQSSVSRDLQLLGVAKDGNAYVAPEKEATVAQAVDVPADFVRGIETAGANLTVVKTAVGAAQRVAVFLDRSGWNEIVGTVSGDDTIFVATRSAQAQKQLIARIQQSLLS